MNKNITILLVLIGIIVLVGGFFGLTQEPDIAFARKVFAGLINGELPMQDNIDWVSFKAAGNDIGKEYSTIPSYKQRDIYQKSFIANFSLAFQSSGGSFDSFSNWRIAKRGKDSAIVAADNRKNKVLLFGISNKSGKRKLTSILWKDNN
jgi:hypothetical protein